MSGPDKGDGGPEKIRQNLMRAKNRSREEREGSGRQDKKIPPGIFLART